MRAIATAPNDFDFGTIGQSIYLLLREQFCCVILAPFVANLFLLVAHGFFRLGNVGSVITLLDNKNSLQVLCINSALKHNTRSEFVQSALPGNIENLIEAFADSLEVKKPWQ